MDDLVSEFITETEESLSVLDMELVKLEQNPNDTEILGNIFRLVHTIKGTCGFLGLPRLERVAHAGENVLGRIRDNTLQVSEEAISLILKSLDRIKDIIEYLAENGEEPEGSDEDLVSRLNHFAETGEMMGGETGGDGDSGVGDATVANASANAEIGNVLPGEGNENDESGDALPEGVETPGIPEGVPACFDGDDEVLQQLFDATPGPDDIQASSNVGGDTGALPAGNAGAPAATSPSAKPTPSPLEEKIKQQGINKNPASPAAGQQGNAKKDSGSNLTNQSIRVNLGVLERLMQMVSELVLTRNQLLQLVRNQQENEFLSPVQQLSHITTELQEEVMKTRMQPIGNAWAKFPRLIRDLSVELNKKIELRMLGAETELDRQLLELIKDPLTHMVRNSCDHGIDTPEERAAAGKPEVGVVTLSAYHEGGHIIIEITDDGRGINIDKVKEKAISSGLATAQELEEMPDHQIIQYIFKAGFSTAEKVTSVSGRGVGMDVVRTNIEKIGGTVELSSEPGKGSKFHIKIPLTLAIVSVLIVEAGEERFALPQINVVELVRASGHTDYKIEEINNSPVLRLRGKLLPLISLVDVLSFPKPEENDADKNKIIVVCKVGGYDFGLVVEKVFDTEEIVVKPVSEMLKSIDIYSGNTILGDGSVIMILDPNGLAKLTGEKELVSDGSDSPDMERLDGKQMISFLLFRAGPGTPKAIPLELVARLEEIDVDNIEYSGEYPVIQYRGELMRLMKLGDDYQIAESGLQEAIVFNYDNRMVGLVVEEILDITETIFDIKMKSNIPNYIGSMVVNGKTTDVVDVAQLLEGVIDDGIQEAYKNKATPRNMLLAEDSPFFRNLTVPFLNAAGYNVTTAANGHEAMEILNSRVGEFDIIVTDIEMPGMDGFEFAELCKRTEHLKNIPIFGFTSTVSSEFLRRSQEIGFHDLVVKTDRAGLLDSIAQVLQSQEAA